MCFVSVVEVPCCCCTVVNLGRAEVRSRLEWLVAPSASTVVPHLDAA